MDARQQLATFGASSRDYAILAGDCRDLLPMIPGDSVDITVTSPPYFQQKDYAENGQIGWKQSRGEYLKALRDVLFELIRVTKPTGSCFIVIADTYKKKCLQLIPQSVALEAVNLGWTVRNDLIWSKTDAPPERVSDRWRYSHEHILFLVKRPVGYRFDMDAIRIPYAEATKLRWGKGQQYGGPKSSEETGPRGQRFRRGKSFELNPKGAIPPDILPYATSRSPHTHYATYPPDLVSKLLEAASVPGDLVLDPINGTGTTGVVALTKMRRFLGFDVSSDYVRIASRECNRALKVRLLESGGKDGG